MRAYAHAWMRACVRACVCVCVRTYVRTCVRLCFRRFIDRRGIISARVFVQAAGGGVGVRYYGSSVTAATDTAVITAARRSQPQMQSDEFELSLFRRRRAGYAGRAGRSSPGIRSACARSPPPDTPAPPRLRPSSLPKPPRCLHSPDH